MYSATNRVTRVGRGGRQCITLLMLWLLSMPAFSAPVLPLKHFTAQGDYLDLKISPDAKHLVARVLRDGRVFAVVIRRADGEIVGGVRSERDDTILTIDWANNERLLYTVAEKWSVLDHPTPTGELFAINIDGSRHEILFGLRDTARTRTLRGDSPEFEKASHEILSMLDADPEHILILEQPWERIGKYYYDRGATKPTISKLNIYSGYREKQERLPYPGAFAFADKRGEVNFIGWRTESARIKSAFRQNSKEPWSELGTELKGLTEIWPISIDKTGTTAYFSAEGGKQGIRQIYTMDVATGSITTDFGTPSADLEDYSVDPTTGEPVISTSWPDKPRYHYNQASGSAYIKFHKQLVRAFPGKHVAIADETPDGQLLLVRVETDVNPGEYYLFDTRRGKVDFLLANASWIDPRDMQTVTPVSVPARDGTTLHGYLTAANTTAQAATGSTPLIVLPHGGPHGIRDYWEFNRETQLLANRGYAVLQINFRGSGGYGNAFERAGFRQWGGQMVDDIIDATRWAIEAGHTKPQRICVYGASYGALAALMVAAKAPQLVQCAVGYAGIYDLERLYDKGDIPDIWGGVAYLERAVGTEPQELRAFSPVHQAERIKAPVLLVHGSKDRRAPILHAKKMRKALNSAGNRPDWLVFPTAGHGVWSEDNNERFYTALLSFLNRHLPI